MLALAPALSTRPVQAMTTTSFATPVGTAPRPQDPTWGGLVAAATTTAGAFCYGGLAGSPGGVAAALAVGALAGAAGFFVAQGHVSGNSTQIEPHSPKSVD
jgi:hypothetical protein